VFDDRQPLVVVHREHRVVVGEDVRHEYRIRRHRAVRRDTAHAHALDGGRNDAHLLIAHVAAFARVGIQAAYRNARRSESPAPREIAVQDLKDLTDELNADRGAHVFERQMSRCQGDPQGTAREQHDWAGRMRALRQILRVTREGRARVI